MNLKKVKKISIVCLIIGSCLLLYSEYLRRH